MKWFGGLALGLLLCGQTAAAQTVNLQGCPATKNEARSLLSGRKVNSRAPSGTNSYATDGIRLMGDPVLGIFAEDYNTSWLHIRLSRAPSAYAAAFKTRYGANAQRVNCDSPDESCYIRMKEGAYGGLHSLDFSTFRGRMEKEGEPDGRYLICFY